MWQSDTCDIEIINSHQWSSVVHSAQSDPYCWDLLRCSSRGPQAGRWQRVRWLETATTGAEHYVPQLGLQSFSFRFDARLPRISCQAANKSIWWDIIYVAWKPLTLLQRDLHSWHATARQSSERHLHAVSVVRTCPNHLLSCRNDWVDSSSTLC